MRERAHIGREEANTEHPHILRQASKQAVIRPVRTIVGYYKLGYSIEEILDGLPHLTPAQVYDALSYYHDHQAETESDIATSEDMEEMSAQLRWQIRKMAAFRGDRCQQSYGFAHIECVSTATSRTNHRMCTL